jgi:hypothetical protein
MRFLGFLQRQDGADRVRLRPRPRDDLAEEMLREGWPHVSGKERDRMKQELRRDGSLGVLNLLTLPYPE